MGGWGDTIQSIAPVEEETLRFVPIMGQRDMRGCLTALAPVAELLHSLCYLRLALNWHWVGAGFEEVVCFWVLPHSGDRVSVVLPDNVKERNGTVALTPPSASVLCFRLHLQVHMCVHTCTDRHLATFYLPRVSFIVGLQFQYTKLPSTSAASQGQK
jgi:hypothetical protein